jgi:[protein-PII] uridylyltransferase
VQIRTTDRAGLLARLTAVFERDGVDIAWAKVTTLGSSVVDVFGITAVGDGNSAGAVGDGNSAGAVGDGDSAGASSSSSRSIRDELGHDLYAVLPAPAPAKPVSEAS